MQIRAPQTQARLFGRASESVTRCDRRQRELVFESPLPPLTAHPNRRRDDDRGLTTESSPLGGAPNERKYRGKILTPVGHPFMTPSERRFAPTTVRQPRNGVRYGLEQVSDIIGIRSYSGGFDCLGFPLCFFLPLSCAIKRSTQARMPKINPIASTPTAIQIVSSMCHVL